jgi:hypothetical protein
MFIILFVKSIICSYHFHHSSNASLIIIEYYMIEYQLSIRLKLQILPFLLFLSDFSILFNLQISIF